MPVPDNIFSLKMGMLQCISCTASVPRGACVTGLGLCRAAVEMIDEVIDRTSCSSADRGNGNGKEVGHSHMSPLKGRSIVATKG